MSALEQHFIIALNVFIGCLLIALTVKGRGERKWGGARRRGRGLGLGKRE